MPHKIVTELNVTADTASMANKAVNIRPQLLDSYIGQEGLMKLLH